MNLMNLAIIGIFILSLEITILIFIKLGLPHNWFKSKFQGEKDVNNVKQIIRTD